MTNPYCYYPHAPIKRIYAQFRVTGATTALSLVKKRATSGSYYNAQMPVITPTSKELWACVRHLSLAVADALDDYKTCVIHDTRTS